MASNLLTSVASNLLTKRSRILGLPIGPREIDWRRVMGFGWAALGVIRLIASFLRGEEKLRHLFDRLPIGTATEALQEGEEVLEEGEKALGKVAGAVDTFNNVRKAVSEASGPFGKIKAFFQALGGGGGGGRDKSKKLRLHIKLAQDVAVPRSVAYNQWTQLEDFPQFMKGVESVELDAEDEEDPDSIARSNWTVKIGFTRRQFSAQVNEAVPDQRIAWESTEGSQHEGVVSFATLDDDDHLTRVQVQMLYVPSGFVEKVGNIFLAARRKARKDLRLYKHYMELTGDETGAWRGEIRPDEDEDEGGDATGGDGAAEDAGAEGER